MSFFFFGMGYSSRAAARAIRDGFGEDVPIHGTTRHSESADALARENVVAHVFDGTQPGATVSDALAGVTHVVHSIAPTEAGDAVFAHHRDDLANAGALEWMCYYSTVGVYGNFEGRWIDETAQCRPINPRGRWRIDAENAWRVFAEEKGVPLLILRLAGIYGPGRSSFDKLRKGTARRIIKPGQVFNRIHVDDIGRVTALAAKRKLAGTFNLADDEPAPPQDLITHAADLAGVAPPAEVPFDQADMTPMARSFYNDNKRVSNAAIKQALGIELLYPNYRAGLGAIHGDPA